MTRGVQVMFVTLSFDSVFMTELSVSECRRRSFLLPHLMPSRRLRGSAGWYCLPVSPLSS